MCDSAFHNEARRKARLLQRQQEYLQAQAQTSVTTPPSLSDANRAPGSVIDPMRQQQLRGLWTMGMHASGQQMSVQRGPGKDSKTKPKQNMMDMYREMHHNSQTLRDNSMYIPQEQASITPDQASSNLDNAPVPMEQPEDEQDYSWNLDNAPVPTEQLEDEQDYSWNPDNAPVPTERLEDEQDYSWNPNNAPVPTEQPEDEQDYSWNPNNAPVSTEQPEYEQED